MQSIFTQILCFPTIRVDSTMVVSLYQFLNLPILLFHTNISSIKCLTFLFWRIQTVMVNKSYSGTLAPIIISFYYNYRIISHNRVIVALCLAEKMLSDLANNSYLTYFNRYSVLMSSILNSLENEPSVLIPFPSIHPLCCYCC